MQLSNQVHRQLLMSPQGIVKRGLVAEYRFDNWRNMLLWSEDFTNAVWQRVNSAVTANAVVAPDGSLTAELLDTQSDAQARIFQDVSSKTIVGENYVYSIYLRSVSSTGTWNIAAFIGDAVTFEYEQVQLTTEWQRFTLPFTRIQPSTVNVYPMDVRREAQTLTQCYAWGAQLQLASQANHSYKKTTDGQTLWNSKREWMYPANKVINGNFTNTANWSLSVATLSVANNIGTITGTGGGAIHSLQQSVARVNTRKYYMRIKVRATNASCLQFKLWLGNTVLAVSQNNPVNGTWYTLDAVATATEDGSLLLTFESVYADAATANGKSEETQEFTVIDLTTLLGAGNEYTTQQCRDLFPVWFDGTATMGLPKYNGTFGSTVVADANDPTPNGQGLSFATDDYIDLGNSSALLPDAFTLELVYKATTAFSVPLLAWNPASGQHPGLFLNYGGNGLLLLYVGGSNYRYFEHTIDVDDGSIHHLIITLPGSYQAAIAGSRAFADGKELKVSSTEQSGTQTAKARLRLGNAQVTYLTGGLYWFNLYNRVVPRAEWEQNWKHERLRMAERGLTIPL